MGREKALLAVDSAKALLDKETQTAQSELLKKQTELSSAIEKLQQNVQNMTRNFNKMRNDYDDGLVSQDEVIALETQLNGMRLDLEILKRQQTTLPSGSSFADLESQWKNALLSLQQVDEALANLEMKAKVSGVLTEVPITVGMTVQAGTRIGLIQKVDPIVIKTQLTDELARLVSGKTELTYLMPGSEEKLTGKISYLANVIDPQTKTYELNLEVANKEAQLKPGMKVRLQLATEQDQMVIAIPTSSIIKQGNIDYVFVLVNNKVEKRKVRLARLNEPLQEVLSGVNEAELLVTSGQNKLNDKDQVQLADAKAQK